MVPRCHYRVRSAGQDSVHARRVPPTAFYSSHNTRRQPSRRGRGGLPRTLVPVPPCPPRTDAARVPELSRSFAGSRTTIAGPSGYGHCTEGRIARGGAYIVHDKASPRSVGRGWTALDPALPSSSPTPTMVRVATRRRQPLAKGFCSPGRWPFIRRADATATRGEHHHPPDADRTRWLHGARCGFACRSSGSP